MPTLLEKAKENCFISKSIQSTVKLQHVVHENGKLRSVAQIGQAAFEQMAADEPNVASSDCPLATIQIEQGNGRRTLNPMQILAKSYRGEKIV